MRNHDPLNHPNKNVQFNTQWSAKCTYLTQVGNRYAALIGDKSAESCISRFFGFFFMAFQSSQVWGNLISSLGKIIVFDHLSELVSYIELVKYFRLAPSTERSSRTEP